MTFENYKLGIEENFLNPTKCIHENPTANIIHNGERPKAFSQISETKQRCPLSLLLCIIMLEFQTSAIKKKKIMKKLPDQKGRTKLPLFTDDMFMHMENPKKSTLKVSRANKSLQQC